MQRKFRYRMTSFSSLAEDFQYTFEVTDDSVIRQPCRIVGHDLTINIVPIIQDVNPTRNPKDKWGVVIVDKRKQLGQHFNGTLMQVRSRLRSIMATAAYRRASSRI